MIYLFIKNNTSTILFKKNIKIRSYKEKVSLIYLKKENFNSILLKRDYIKKKDFIVFIEK